MDLELAKQILRKSYEDASLVVPELLDNIDVELINEIINGSHLTFRYILVTALLAKNVDPSIHMRALQAKSMLTGAYDARSLCHKVLVPFERDFMQSRLGGSNEPFLNKPARFAEVSTTNPVRKGKDKKLLFHLYDLLESLNSSSVKKNEEAFLYSLQLVQCRPAKLQNLITLKPVLFDSLQYEDALRVFLQRCLGGETAVAVVGAILRWFEKKEGGKVKAHPVNQAGSSSKEVGDIDIFRQDDLIYSVEVKDKDFEMHDIQHAMAKVLEAGKNRLIFVFGGHSRNTPPVKEMMQLIRNYSTNGLDLTFVTVDQMLVWFLGLASLEEKGLLVKDISCILDEIRATDETRDAYLSSFCMFLV